MIAFYPAGETLTLGHPGNINQVTGFKEAGINLLPDFNSLGIIYPELSEVLKGLRMAGHMGSDQVTVRHLEVLEADATRNLLLVKGAVPGARNGLLIIKKISGEK